MAEKIDAFKERIAGYTLEKPERKPQQNYVSVLILRELQSAARFTTDGTEANSAIIRIGEIEETVRQTFWTETGLLATGELRKRFREPLSRTRLNTVAKKGAWDGCSMVVNSMCQRCPECALFGSSGIGRGDQHYVTRDV